ETTYGPTEDTPDTTSVNYKPEKTQRQHYEEPPEGDQQLYTPATKKPCKGTKAPTYSTTYPPTQEITNGPTEETTYGPTEETTYAPTEETTYGPTEETTYAPTEETTYGPTEETTYPPTHTHTHMSTYRKLLQELEYLVASDIAA
ncbi:hypothetical protein F442_10894, partial [Phytophthora nicotianae P10297]